MTQKFFASEFRFHPQIYNIHPFDQESKKVRPVKITSKLLYAPDAVVSILSRHCLHSLIIVSGLQCVLPLFLLPWLAPSPQTSARLQPSLPLLSGSLGNLRTSDNYRERG